VFPLVLSPLEHGFEEDVVLDGGDGDREAQEGHAPGSGGHLVISEEAAGSLAGGDGEPGEDVEVPDVPEELPGPVVVLFPDEDVDVRGGAGAAIGVGCGPREYEPRDLRLCEPAFDGLELRPDGFLGHR